MIKIRSSLFFTIFSSLAFSQALPFPGPGGVVASGGGGITLKTSTNPATVCAGNATAVNISVTTTGANAIFISTSSSAAGVSTVTSTLNASGWVKLYEYGNGNPQNGLWFKQNATAGADTFTITGAGGASSFVGACIMAFSGMVTSGMNEGISNNTGVVFPATPAQPGSITPGSGNQLIITTESDATGGTTEPWTLNGGFLSPAIHIPTSGGVNYAVGISYLVQVGSTVTNPTWTPASGTPGANLGQAAFQGM